MSLQVSFNKVYDISSGGGWDPKVHPQFKNKLYQWTAHQTCFIHFCPIIWSSELM